MTTTPTLTDRLRQLERQLHELAVVIDGRHAKDGMVTWPMIRDSVEDCWRQLVAVLDGDAYAATAAAPSMARRRAEADLEKVCNLLEVLQDRIAAIRHTL